MAETVARTGLTPRIWDSKFFTEYVRENRFIKYMGEDDSNIIVVKESLTSKAGDSVMFAAARAIGGGVEGNTVLEGNEAPLDLQSMPVVVRPLRNGVIVTDWEEQKSAIDIRDAARSALKVWSKEKMREDIITALKSEPNAAGVMTRYENLTAAEKNTFLVNNMDRMLFGNSVGHGSSGVMATALATVTATNDKLTAATIDLAVRRAEMANPRITPTMTKGTDQEWYMLFCNPLSFRDLRNDPTMALANRDARERNVNTNPIFTGGDLVYGGVIIREIPEMGLPIAGQVGGRLGQTGAILQGVGSGGIDVGFNFLCGAGALGMAWAQRTRTTVDNRDYDFRHGVGISEIRGVQKLMFGSNGEGQAPVQNGIVTIFTAAVADS